MDTYPIVKLRKRSSLLYAILCEMYCEDGEEPVLSVGKDGTLFFTCKQGTFDLWHGMKYLDQLEDYLKSLVKYGSEKKERGR